MVPIDAYEQLDPEEPEGNLVPEEACTLPATQTLAQPVEQALPS